MSVKVHQIAKVLGGTQVLGVSVRQMSQLESMVSEGLPRGALDTFIAYFSDVNHIDYAVALRNMIIPRASYQRSQKLNLQVSETTERLARLFAMVNEVFDDEEATKLFFIRPHPELDNRVPIEVALTEIGGRRVEEVIARGIHGLPV